MVRLVNRIKGFVHRVMPARWRLNMIGAEFCDAGEREVLLLRKLSEPGTAVIDAGANLGQYVWNLATLSKPPAMIVAFEPVPDLAAYLAAATRRYVARHAATIGVAILLAELLASCRAERLRPPTPLLVGA